MRLSTIALFTLSIAAAVEAGAQPTPPSARQACRSSAMSLCRTEVRAGDRSSIKACLIRNFDQVTPDCQTAMKAMQAKMRTDEQKPTDMQTPKP